MNDTTLLRPSSWVIRNKFTKEPIWEIFDAELLLYLNYEKYEFIDALSYLQEINTNLKRNPKP